MITSQTVVVENVIPRPKNGTAVVIYRAKEQIFEEGALNPRDLHPAYTEVPVNDCSLRPGNEIQVYREKLRTLRTLGIYGNACIACNKNPYTHEGLPRPCQACFIK